MSRSRPPYQDRTHAGQVLATHLGELAGRSGLVLLALPRGGVPVAAGVAERLGAPIGALVVRKLGVPEHPELAMGALASVGGRVQIVRNESVIHLAGVSEDGFEAARRREQLELERRLSLLSAAPVRVEGRTVVVVDDGLATGATMRAAVAAVRQQRPAEIVVAVPVGAREAIATLVSDGVQVVCPLVPAPFRAVGLAYADFTQTSDDEVRLILAGP